MAYHLNTDGFPVTPDEAAELTIHHLRLAALFFEVAPDDENRSLLDELKRQALTDARGMDCPWAKAASIWLGLMHSTYEAMKEDE